MEFSQWLQEQMVKHELTKYKLHKLSGVHQSTIANLLDDKEPSKPQMETEEKIRLAIAELEKKKEKPDPTTETGLSTAKQKLLSIIDELSDEQCEKLLGIIEEAKKLL